MNPVIRHWLGYLLAAVMVLQTPFALAFGCSDHVRHTDVPVQVDMADCAEMHRSHGAQGMEQAMPEPGVAPDSVDDCCQSGCACPALAPIVLLPSETLIPVDDHAVLVATTSRFRISAYAKVLTHPPI